MFKVSHKFQKIPTTLAVDISNLLKTHAASLTSDLRRTLISAVSLMRTHKQISLNDTISLYLVLFKCRDKALRAFLFKTIIGCILNAKEKCEAIKSVLFSIINGNQNAALGVKKVANSVEQDAMVASSDGMDAAMKSCLDVCVTLYKKQKWTDEKTIRIIATACFSPVFKVMVSAISFFLTNDTPGEDENSDDEDSAEMEFPGDHSKSTRAKRSKIEKVKKEMKKRQKREKSMSKNQFSAIQNLNNAQGFVERLFQHLNGSKRRELKFEVKLMILDLMSRVISIHKLTVINFYPFMNR